MVDDCVSYLDIGDAYARRDFAVALNGYWSPAYSWLLALVTNVLRPSLRWEFPTVHLVNFVVFAVGLWAFDLFVRELIAANENSADGPAVLSSQSARVLGCALFTWCGLGLVSLTWTGADMLLTLVVTVAFALLVRVRRRPANRWAWVGLGAALGVAYLSKAVMLPVGLVFLLAATVRLPTATRGKGLMHCAAVFAGLAAAFAIPLSISRGRPTFGEAGQLNFAWHVNHVAKAYWRGGPPGNGTPIHSYQKVVKAPSTWVFGGPFQAVTYAPWYDPSYWYEGIRLRLSPREILARVRASGPRLKSIVLGLQGTVLATVVLAVLLGEPGGRWRRVVGALPLLLPVLAALSIYLVIRFEARYIAPFLAPSLLVLACASRGRGGVVASRTIACLIGLLGIGLVVHVAGVFRAPPSEADRFGDVAEGLRRLGARSGDRAATLEFASDDHSPWARLAQLRIIGEVESSDEHPDERAYWSATAAARQRVLAAFRDAGARLVVSREAPANEPGWIGIGGTGYSVLFLVPVEQ